LQNSAAENFRGARLEPRSYCNLQGQTRRFTVRYIMLT